MSKAIAAEAEEIQLPFLRPEEYAAHGLLLEQSPLVPIPSPKISGTLAKMRFFLSDEVFRRHTAPKLRILGLQAHPKYGYFYPLGARARRMGPSNPSTSKSHG